MYCSGRNRESSKHCYAEWGSVAVESGDRGLKCLHTFRHHEIFLPDILILTIPFFKQEDLLPRYLGSYAGTTGINVLILGLYLPR